MTIQFLWFWCDQYNCFRFQRCNKSPINTLPLNTARWYHTPPACKKLRGTGAKKRAQDHTSRTAQFSSDPCLPVYLKAFDHIHCCEFVPLGLSSGTFTYFSMETMLMYIILSSSAKSVISVVRIWMYPTVNK